jgi:hypothetical protein
MLFPFYPIVLLLQNYLSPSSIPSIDIGDKQSSARRTILTDVAIVQTCFAIIVSTTNHVMYIIAVEALLIYGMFGMVELWCLFSRRKTRSNSIRLFIPSVFIGISTTCIGLLLSKVLALEYTNSDTVEHMCVVLDKKVELQLDDIPVDAILVCVIQCVSISISSAVIERDSEESDDAEQAELSSDSSDSDNNASDNNASDNNTSDSDNNASDTDNNASDSAESDSDNNASDSDATSNSAESDATESDYDTVTKDGS